MKYCKIHNDEEIVFACYECSDMFCQRCQNSHCNHKIVFFKDSFVYPNYENVRQLQIKDQFNSQQLPAGDKKGTPQQSEKSQNLPGMVI